MLLWHAKGVGGLPNCNIEKYMPGLIEAKFENGIIISISISIANGITMLLEIIL